jgi:hypothetical protein
MDINHHRQPTLCYLIAEAAMIARRSQSWVRNHRRFGPLVATVIDQQQAVTAASLHDFLVSIEKQKANRKRAADHLRLVVDNTK